VRVVALAPGTAPGEDGAAPVAGAPDGGRDERALVLRLEGEKKRFAAGQPVPVEVVAEAPGAPAVDLDLSLRIVLDDAPEIDTGRRLFLPAGAPGRDGATLDLRALAGKLAPGEHTAVARAGDATSNVYRFTIEPPADGPSSLPPPPEDPPTRPPAPEPQPAGGGKDKVRPRYVEPLVQDGPQVQKRAKVPIEVPEGGAPSDRPLHEAWPDLKKRAEEALRRPGLSPSSKKLVREYFERLRPAPEDAK
jgi:hypothetical protein